MGFQELLELHQASSRAFATQGYPKLNIDALIAKDKDTCLSDEVAISSRQDAMHEADQSPVSCMCHL